MLKTALSIIQIKTLDPHCFSQTNKMSFIPSCFILRVNKGVTHHCQTINVPDL